jgi:hypothetical protein
MGFANPVTLLPAGSYGKPVAAAVAVAVNGWVAECQQVCKVCGWMERQRVNYAAVAVINAAAAAAAGTTCMLLLRRGA